MASVAEVKAAIDVAMAHVQEGQEAVRAANDKLDEARASLAAAVDGSAHESVVAARSALAQAAAELDECMSATLGAMEQAQTYAAAL
ncbi:hypothetical protein [Asanoa siamensis]|uniref:Uncharacterized protein n=1 Tax=Asanoa siamensis TaxID=926357 RepID=A0ABQ4CIU7_9ACTN|nr:hypothetical protein [Asanoa siamensis]GIF71209.1 hypothetical protein Asi02nite_07270 [Asanoa siamensis]